jgi:cysteine desulfurase
MPTMMPKTKKRVFLDYASTTPVLPEVFKAMKPYFQEDFGNPSALYEEGAFAKKAVEKARKEIASILSAHSDEIVFTASGTESINLSVTGVVSFLKSRIKKPHIITSSFEHPAVLETLQALEFLGVEVTYVSPNEKGIIEPNDIMKSLKGNTILVSIMYANNEIGTIQPIKEIAKTIRFFRKSKKKNLDLPYFHTDASQAANYLSLNTLELHTDLLTLDASKIYGPKGIGLLYIRRGVKVSPIIFGGGQEEGRRSGTENISHIVGFAKALSVAVRFREGEVKRLTLIRDYGIKTILNNHKKARLNGDSINRLPNNINICFPKLDAEFTVIKLDSLGFAISSSSSCRTLSENANSYVIEAIGIGRDCAQSSLRITLGRETKKSDIVQLSKALKRIVS